MCTVDEEIYHTQLSVFNEYLPSYSTEFNPTKRVKQTHTRYSTLTEAWIDFNPIGSLRVCQKVFRPLSQRFAEQEKKCFEKEVRVWRQFNHPNIVPILGSVSSQANCLSVIVPWYDKGTAPEFLKASQTGGMIIPILSDIVEGMRYLHENLTIHGDLKGANVFVNDINRAVLTDFGILPRIQADIESTSDSLPSLRWFAPELFIEGERMNIRTDIYSLGSTILELITGERPYECLNERQVLQKVLQRCSPAETAGAFRYHISENLDLLHLLNRCWSSPADRPSIDEIAEFFQSLQAKELTIHFHFHPPPAYSPRSPSQALVPEV